MNTWLVCAKRLGLVFFVAILIFAGGCEGTDTHDKVDDTVETMAGKKDVERYKKMKEDLNDIQKKEKARYRQLDPDAKDE